MTVRSDVRKRIEEEEFVTNLQSEAERLRDIESEPKYEFCVMHRGGNEPHVGPMSLIDALEWKNEAIECGFREDAFSVMRRPVGPWEVEW